MHRSLVFLGSMEPQQQKRELVAAQTGHGIAAAQAGADAVRDFRQDEIADVMAVGVVDRLELVQVEIADHQESAAAMRLCNRLAHAVGE